MCYNYIFPPPSEKVKHINVFCHKKLFFCHKRQPYCYIHIFKFFHKNTHLSFNLVKIYTTRGASKIQDILDYKLV